MTHWKCTILTRIRIKFFQKAINKYILHDAQGHNYIFSGAIIRDGDRKSWDARGPMIIFLFLEQIASS